jgi:hypothetical protein
MFSLLQVEKDACTTYPDGSQTNDEIPWNDHMVLALLGVYTPHTGQRLQIYHSNTPHEYKRG